MRMSLSRRQFLGLMATSTMIALLAGASPVDLVTVAHAQTATFDADAPGAAPAGWQCGSTGGGAPRWTVEAEASAPSKSNVLKQSGSGVFDDFTYRAVP